MHLTVPDVSIILPTKNGARYIDEVLRGIFAQTDAPPFEVILIDSGSTDGTLDIAASYPVRIEQISPASFNHGGTRNLGAQLGHSASRYLVFLTQDATPLPGWLARLIAPLQADAEVAGAFSRHVPRPDCNPLLARQITQDWEQCGTPERVMKRITDPADFERRKVHYVYFADTSSCIRRSVWQQHPFPTTNFAEDAQWAEAVLLAGHALVYEPQSAVLHSHSHPLREHWQRNRDHARAMSRFADARTIPGISGGMLRHAARTVARDWRYLWTHREMNVQDKVYWTLLSPVWHGAAGLGSLSGIWGRT